MDQTYRALLLDLDGTLIGPTGFPHPRTKAAIGKLVAGGVTVMVATGRSDGGTVHVLEHLGLKTPAVIFNGAGIWCPERGRLIEERTLSDRKVARVFDFAHEHDMPLVAMRAGKKFAREPRSDGEAACLIGLENLEFVESGELPRERLMRITLFSDQYTDSEDMVADLEASVGQPLYYTNFPIASLYEHKGSPYQVVDVQPPCRGKGEAVRFLGETLGIPPEAIVAVGDAGNDLPMFREAGLAVAMANAMQSARDAADRVIGDADSDTLADLAEELFPSCFG